MAVQLADILGFAPRDVYFGLSTSFVSTSQTRCIFLCDCQLKK